jgi:zinc transport system permease protein
MPDLTPLYALIAQLLPFDCLQARFMQQAMTGLLLLAPMAAAMGIMVVNFRMAFFADAISHSAFAGVALGLIFSVDPNWTMPTFGLCVGLGIMILQRHSSLSSDTVIGVFFSSMVAFGLAIVSRDRSLARDLQRFLYGDILTISDTQILCLLVLFLIFMTFQVISYNHLLYIGLNPTLARAHRVRVAAHQYIFAGLLSLIVMFAVQAVGVLLVTAMLIVPAAAARNVSRSAGSMFWWALLVSISSAIIGLIVSAQDWARTATGATIILVACCWFLLSLAVSTLRGDRASS